MIQRHSQAVEVGHLAAIHSVQAHAVFIGIGGFRFTYPIFEKSLSSNMSLKQKADIWIQLFKILRTFMNVEPFHILRIFSNRNLIETLKYCIIRAGMIEKFFTRELLQRVFKIVRDLGTNKHYGVLEPFYKKFFYEIILNETICKQTFTDYRHN
jgi:hypothetical protein